MKRTYILLLAAAGLIAFGAGCSKDKTNSNDNSSLVNQGLGLNEALDLNVTEDLNANESIDENTNEDVNTNDSISTNTNTASNQNTNTAVKNSNTNSATTSSGTITITGPKTDDELSSPFYVEGTVTSGDSVYVRLKASGSTIFTEKVSVNNKAFRGKLLIDFSRSTSGTIEVFQKDADGDETGLAAVDVRFKIGTTNSNANSNTNAPDDSTLNENTNSGY